jgi:hypothetical protein
MKIRRMFAFALAAIALSGFYAPAIAGQPTSSGTTGPYSAVEVRQIPVANAALAGPHRLVPRHFPNVNVLVHLKQAFAAGARPAPAKPSRGKPKPTRTATPTATPTVVAPTPTPTPTPTATATPVPPTAQNFSGLQFSDSGGWVPPDTTIGAGPVYLFEAVNLAARIFDKTGNIVSNFSLYSFFKVSTSTSLTDPRIIFDPDSQRWFVVTATVGSRGRSGSWNLAVSAGTGPSGAFYLYAFSISGSYPDFPKVGVNKNKVVLTGDAFAGNSFLGTEFIVLNKSQLIAGHPVNYDYYAPPQGLFAIEPALHESPAAAAPNDNLYMAAVAYNSASQVQVWAVSGVPGQGGSHTTAKALTISTLMSPPDAQQKGSNQLVVTNDNALLDAVYRDGSSTGDLWVSANDACNPDNEATTRSCARYIDIAIPSGDLGSATLAEDFDYGDLGTYYYYPTVRTDNAGDLITVFSGSSSSIYPSVYSAYQLAGLPGPPTLTGLSIVKGGDAAYTQASRWGDYSGAGVDPADDMTVWVGGEYSTLEPCSSGKQCSAWGTWIANVKP